MYTLIMSDGLYRYPDYSKFVLSYSVRIDFSINQNMRYNVLLS